jgi:hypothetical protein
MAFSFRRLFPVPELTNKRIRRESWGSVEELKEAINSCIESWNQPGRVFKWTKPADKIIAAVAKAKKTYNVV